jgi:glycosyltransferase involved in cell wall biosynthesis
MSRRPVIAIDARMARASGIGVYIRNVVPRIVGTMEQYTFRVIARSGELTELGEQFPDRVTLAHATSALYGLREQLELPALIPHDVSLYWSPHYVIPLAFRGPLVATVHDLAHLALPEFFGRWHRRLYARSMFAMLRRRARHVFCVSHFTARQLVELTGFPPERLSVVYNGVPESWLMRRMPPQRTSKLPYLLYVGNVKPHKNLRRLLEAFESLRERMPHELLIVGRRTGFRTGDAAALRFAERLESRVRFSGEVAEHELRVLYEGAAALVLPSLYEGFGLPPLEAMACGAPVIVSDRGALPEVCGDAAEYCDAESVASIARAIARVTGSPDHAEALRARGFARVAGFRWEAASDAIAGVLDRVVSSSRGRPPTERGSLSVGAASPHP